MRISRCGVSGGVAVAPDERMHFTYDSLDRLIAAMKTTNDGYNQSFAYNPIGNLTTMVGVTQGYNDPLHKHAVTHLNGAQKFWYDANPTPLRCGDFVGI